MLPTTHLPLHWVPLFYLGKLLTHPYGRVGCTWRWPSSIHVTNEPLVPLAIHLKSSTCTCNLILNISFMNKHFEGLSFLLQTKRRYPSKFILYFHNIKVCLPKTITLYNMHRFGMNHPNGS